MAHLPQTKKPSFSSKTADKTPQGGFPLKEPCTKASTTCTVRHADMDTLLCAAAWAGNGNSYCKDYEA